MSELPADSPFRNGLPYDADFMSRRIAAQETDTAMLGAAADSYHFVCLVEDDDRIGDQMRMMLEGDLFTMLGGAGTYFLRARYGFPVHEQPNTYTVETGTVIEGITIIAPVMPLIAEMVFLDDPSVATSELQGNGLALVSTLPEKNNVIQQAPVAIPKFTRVQGQSIAVPLNKGNVSLVAPMIL